MRVPDNLPAAVTADPSAIDDDFFTQYKSVMSDGGVPDSDGNTGGDGVPAQTETRVPAVREQPATPAPAAAAPATPARVADEPPATAVDPVSNVTSMLERLRQNGGLPAVKAPAAQPVATQPAAPAASQKGEAPHQYQLTVPAEIVNDLRSEDLGVVNRGLTVLVNSLATVIHATVRTELDGKLRHLAGWAARNAHAISQKLIQQDRVRADFYGAFPDLNHPVLHPIVEQVMNDTIQQTGATAWSPELRDMIGNNVRVAVRTVALGPDGARAVMTPPAQPASTVAAKPAAPAPRATFNSGARPAPAVDPTGFADEWDLMARAVVGR
jgi:hypothetical protein